MKLPTMALAITPLIGPASAFAQNGNMMDGSWMGGWMGSYGGAWVLILLVIVVGLVAWIVMQKRK